VAVNRRGEDIVPLLQHAEHSFTIDTTWGDLDAVVEKSLTDAEAKNQQAAVAPA
jgi:hypothetical protein